MKQSREKTKIVAETIDISMFVTESPAPIIEKKYDSIKETYETPAMVTKTID